MSGKSDGWEWMVFLSEAQVMVTSERLTVGGQIYALKGVTSIRHETQSPSQVGPIVTLVIGLSAFIAAVGFQSVVTAYAGILFLAVGLWWERGQKPRQVVILGTPSGELKALTDWDERFTLRVVQALTDAIARQE